MLEKFGRFDIQALLVVGPFSKLESVVGKSYQVDKQRAMRLRDVPLRYRSTSIIPSLHTFSIVIIETATGRGFSLLSRRMSVYPGCQGLWSSEIKTTECVTVELSSEFPGCQAVCWKKRHGCELPRLLVANAIEVFVNK